MSTFLSRIRTTDTLLALIVTISGAPSRSRSSQASASTSGSKFLPIEGSSLPSWMGSRWLRISASTNALPNACANGPGFGFRICAQTDLGMGYASAVTTSSPFTIAGAR